MNTPLFLSVCAFNCHLYFPFIHVKDTKSRPANAPSQHLIGHDAVVGAHGDLLGADNAVLKGGRGRRTVIWQ